MNIKYYSQMGKVLRLTFAALFWALNIVLGHILQQVTQPAGLASLNHGTVRQCNVIGSIFPSDVAVIFIYGPQSYV